MFFAARDALIILCVIVTLIYFVTAYPLDKWQRNQHDKTVTQVIIVGQMRSGSSFVGELFNQHPNSFYIFEPLRALGRKSFKDHNSVLRSIRGDPHTDTEVPQIMKRLLECDFSNVPFSVLADDFMLRSKHGADFYKCVRTNTSDEQLREKCITTLKQNCHQSSLRAIKTIRVTFNTIQILLNLMPNLKVIYLIRDPRAIIQSRISLQMVGETNVEEEAKRLCHRMDQDIMNIKNCRNHKRVKIVQYEKLAKYAKDQTSIIFSFLDKSQHPDVYSWLKLNTEKAFDLNPFSTSRNSNMSTEIWKSTIKEETIETIEKYCSDLISIFGYKPFKELKRSRF